LESLNCAVCRQFPNGMREAANLERHLMSDNGGAADFGEVYAR
jgi:hypothetical protein